MQNDLNHRKRQIDREKSALSFDGVRRFALRFRSHFFDLFNKSAHSLNSALNWKKLDFYCRWAHVKTLLRHSLAFGGSDYYNVDVKLAANDRKTKNVMGAANAKNIIIYEDLLKSDDYDKVAEVCSHESTHVFQTRKGNTTLSSDTVKNCYLNYVQPYESYDYYRENPIEIEAFKVGRSVGNNLSAALLKLSSRARAA
jgi:hypothetical protein